MGLRAGGHDQAEQQLALAEEHYQRGLVRLDAGEYEWAIAEFRYTLELNPDHPFAAQGLAEAERGLAARPTPTSPATEEVARDLYDQGRTAYEESDWEAAIAALSQLRTVDPEYEAAAVEEMLFASFYNLGREAYEQEDWETAAQSLGQLRILAPEYEAEAVEDMLYTSLLNHGLALLAANQFEEGIFYLERAGEIRPLGSDALLELEFARRYMEALGYWGVNWPLCIRRFEDLYAVAPGYKDVFYRLYQSRVEYGDLWYERGEMCPAAAQYARALELMSDTELEQRRSEASELCAVATPTPIPPLTGTLPITGTVIVPDFQVGRLAYPAYNPEMGLYDVYAIISGGQLTRIVSGADQPCWQWGTDRLIYRNRLIPGIAVIQPGGQPATLRADAAAAWPVFSPDGSRYAYAALDAAGSWQIYIARTDGSEAPQLHAAGQGPAWGPSGLLAWTGCETDGSACGIFADNPDDDQLPHRLTASINDVGLHWAPSGDLLAYMSDHGGSWDIYLLSMSGGVVALTDDPTIEALPAWAPDGSGLAFLSYRDGNWGLYLMDPSGGNVRQVIALGETLPNWQSQRLCWAP